MFVLGELPKPNNLNRAVSGPEMQGKMELGQEGSLHGI